MDEENECQEDALASMLSAPKNSVISEQEKRCSLQNSVEIGSALRRYRSKEFIGMAGGKM